MSIFLWLVFIVYLTAVSLTFFYYGLIWNCIETKYKRYPYTPVIITYILNMLVVNLVFDVPILLQFILYSLQMGGVYFGTLFQCIGLTGGIACGKSTVSGILAENGFDIIDADKLSKEVSKRLTHVFMMEEKKTKNPSL